MKDFHTNLLREKFTIHDQKAIDLSKSSVIALSNRIELKLSSLKDAPDELIVIRAHNMHSCARMAARIVNSYAAAGSLLTRSPAFDWAWTWNSSFDDYERIYNPQRWIAVYENGKPLYANGEYHPFLDILEKCQGENNAFYERSIALAEDIFRQSGKAVKIDYDGNVALSIHLGAQQSRFGVIVRGPLKTATFNFTVAPKTNRVNFGQALSAAAAFLEGIQLAFMIGINNEKIRTGAIERGSVEERQTREARHKLVALNNEISNLEATADVRYRPDRPDFQKILLEAERMMRGR